MSERQLPLLGRSKAYLLLVGAVSGMLIAGLAVPMVFGESVTSGSDRQAASSFGPGDATTTTVAPVGAGASVTTTTLGGTPAGGAATAGPGFASAPSAGGQTTAAAGPALTASDRGVTATTIKVGALLLDVATVGRMGVGVAIDPAQQQAGFQAFFDEINARGGINGRKIEPYYRAFDVTDRNDQIAACRYLTQEKQVFTVLAGFNTVDPTVCIVEENKTPLISTSANNPDWVFARAGGRLITLYPHSGRMMSALVSEMERTHLADKKIGIETDGLNDPGGQVAAQFQQLLEQRGHKVVYRGLLSEDIPTASSQVPIEVNRMRTAGAEVVVFLQSNAVYGTQFVNSSDGQGYHPQYVNSDWASGNGDSTSANMPSSYGGAWAFTFNRGLSGKQSLPTTGVGAHCRDIYNARSGRKLSAPNTAEYGLTLTNCDVVRVFQQLATTAGTQLTRDRLVAGRTRFPPFDAANFSPGSLGLNKFDMSDQVRTERWGYDCKCWHPVDAFHPPGG